MNPLLLLEAAQTGGESPFFVLLIGVLGLAFLAATALRIYYGGDG